MDPRVTADPGQAGRTAGTVSEAGGLVGPERLSTGSPGSLLSCPTPDHSADFPRPWERGTSISEPLS